MTTTGTLVLLRHGETEYNREGRLTGHTDIPLLPEGEAQAREAGELLKALGIHFDEVYSSPLQRAFNTASLALKAAGQAGAAIEKRDALIESNSGDFTGRTWQDPEIAAWKWIYAHPMPNGESNKQIVARVRDFFEGEVLPRLARGENVLLAAHAGVLRAFMIVLGIEPVPADDAPGAGRSSVRIPNAAPFVCVYEDGKLKSHSFAEKPQPRAGGKDAPKP